VTRKYLSHGERKLAGIIRRNGIALSYTGNPKHKTAFWVTFSDGTHACPDYMNQNKRKVLELWGSGVHTIEEMTARAGKYREKNWDCFLLNDFDLYHTPEPKLVKQIVDFVERQMPSVSAGTTTPLP
jgi:hypothetical protein